VARNDNKELPPKFWEGKGKGIWILQKFCAGNFLFVFSYLHAVSAATFSLENPHLVIGSFTESGTNLQARRWYTCIVFILRLGFIYKKDPAKGEV
jgi:hypothetical protein